MRANLQPMQDDGPPENVSIEENAPGIFVALSGTGLVQRSTLNSLASGPQIAVLRLMPAILRRTSVPLGTKSSRVSPFSVLMGSDNGTKVSIDALYGTNLSINEQLADRTYCRTIYPTGGCLTRSQYTAGSKMNVVYSLKISLQTASSKGKAMRAS